MTGISSRSVRWETVHAYVEPVLARHPGWPMVGTDAWEQADDPTRVAALFDAARHWALHVENCQRAAADASKAVAASADWPSLAKRIVPRGVA
jgi:hypothetical protein